MEDGRWKMEARHKPQCGTREGRGKNRGKIEEGRGKQDTSHNVEQERQDRRLKRKGKIIN
jgi:hypothetical protein